MFYQVLLPIASDPLTYSHDDILEEGQLVVVCLRGKNVVGMIVGNLPPATDSFKVKKITKLLDIAPIKSIMRSFMLWVSSYNMIPLGSVFKMLVGVLGAGSYRQIQSKLEEKIVTDALKLSEAQLRVVNEICTDLDRYNPCLLQGVTGSGKTEVYLEIAKRVIMRSGQVLVLLPEILLSTQLADRFERHISNCAVWHSGVTQKKKLDIWMQTQTGSIKFVVGPRSALYLPFLNLKLIVVDEEHDTSFKQEEKQVYNARDMAVVRAKMEEATIVLSSATPSIESLYNVRRSVYRYFKLNTRYSGVEQPLVKVVDMKNQSAMQPATRALLHPITLQEIQSTLDKNKQVLLFMNRRGYATIAFCLNCSEKISCRNCHASLVYHKKNSALICHYCGEQVEFNPKDNLCQFCKSQNKIVTAGVGVEKLEQVVKHLFPAARTITVSSDLIGHSSQKSAELIRKITENEVDIIIGTQILAKGLHFEKLHLVVIVEANNEYISPDIRALEKTYQVLQQVIGRAGRESARGLVIVQTSNPSDEMIRYIVNYDEKGFIEMELRNRERALMPPFARLAAITVSSTDEVRLLEWLKDFSRDVNVLNTEDLTILGPAPAPIYKLRNKFRYRFIIRAKKSISIQKVIKELLSKLFKPSYIDFKIDIDPYNFI